ncbi:MAG: hydroxyacid dehydrogenase [Candidatus Methanoperedenaceae archaeon]|nr:MAG: hydroxyacid dehydrogenase [Candidatus Methanoperedenaceae archaeon]
MKILISSASFGKINRDPLKILEDAGYTPILNPYGRKLEFGEFIELIKDASGLIAGTEKVTAEILEKAPLLKVISRYGVGVDNIDLEAAKKMGIIVKSTPEAPSQAVAELTLALMLDISRRTSEADRNVRNNKWTQLMGRLISGKTLGIIGLGRIGKKLVKLVQPFEMKIYAFEPYPDKDFVLSNNIILVPFHEVLKVSDIISLHLPLSDKTFHMIAKKELSLMKKDAIIINSSRGSLVDENALISALRNRTIGGAAIDTFEQEPYKGDLIGFENVLLTCHMGSAAQETRKLMEIETVNNLLDALKEVDI